MQCFIFKWHLVSESCQAKVLIIFIQPLLLTENERVYIYKFFAATVVERFFDIILFFLKIVNGFNDNFTLENSPRTFTSHTIAPE